MSQRGVWPHFIEETVGGECAGPGPPRGATAGLADQGSCTDWADLGTSTGVHSHTPGSSHHCLIQRYQEGSGAAFPKPHPPPTPHVPHLSSSREQVVPGQLLYSPDD